MGAGTESCRTPDRAPCPARGQRRLHGAHLRRNRDRQGALGKAHPRPRSTGQQAVHTGQLRRADRDAGRKPIVRPREGRIHRRRGPLGRRVPRRRGRHGVSRRSRRDAARAAAQAAARAARARSHARRRRLPGAGRRADRGGHEPRLGSGGDRGPIPRGLVLSLEHGRAADSAAARSGGGHSRAGRVFLAAVRRAVPAAAVASGPRNTEEVLRISLAGQRAATLARRRAIVRARLRSEPAARRAPRQRST